MKTNLLTLNPESSLEEALSIMIANRIHHLPVVAADNPEYLVGFVTTTDIMRAYTKRMNQ